MLCLNLKFSGVYRNHLVKLHCLCCTKGGKAQIIPLCPGSVWNTVRPGFYPWTTDKNFHDRPMRKSRFSPGVCWSCHCSATWIYFAVMCEVAEVTIPEKIKLLHVSSLLKTPLVRTFCQKLCSMYMSLNAMLVKSHVWHCKVMQIS